LKQLYDMGLRLRNQSSSVSSSHKYEKCGFNHHYINFLLFFGPGGFNPNNLTSYLKQFDMVLKEDLDATEYRNRYMPERTSILEGYEFYRVAMAKRWNRIDSFLKKLSGRN
jgi:hypothetical protein